MKKLFLMCFGVMNLSSLAFAGGISAGGPASFKDTVCKNGADEIVVQLFTKRLEDQRIAEVTISGKERTVFDVVNKIPLRVVGKLALYSDDNQTFSLLINENNPVVEGKDMYSAFLDVVINGEKQPQQQVFCTLPVVDGGKIHLVE